MLLRTLSIAFALLATPALAAPAALDPTGAWDQPQVGHAPTPPMGWNTWNAFHLDLSEAGVLGSAQVLVDSGLADLGYRHVNIDDGWWLRRGDDGRLVVRTNLFPSAALPDGQTSFRPLTDRLHAMGLKAGIYSDIGRNACSQAWAGDVPNLPQGTMAEREVGLYGHVRPDLARYFGEWGFDFIKVDGCGIAHYGADEPRLRGGRFRALAPLIDDTDPGRDRIEDVRALYAEVRDGLRAVRPAGDFVLALCNWGTANVRAWGPDVGTTWRTSGDIDPTWDRFLHNFDSVATRELYAGPGHWNDPDMLEIGNGEFDAGHLTEAEAHLAAFAVVAAPLIIGTDLVHARPEILRVLGNHEVISVDQDPAGNQGVIAYADSSREIVVKALARHGAKAALLFNRSATPVTITLTPAQLKLADDAPVSLRDLIRQRDLGVLGAARRFDLAPHQAMLIGSQGTPLAGSGRYLSEMTGRIHVAADGITAPQPDPTLHLMVDPKRGDTAGLGPHPVYYGWGAPRADTTPFAETLTIAGERFRSGLGVIANSRLQWRADGEFGHLHARVGVDDSTRGRSSAVRFEIWGDGRLLARTGDMRFGMPPAALDPDIAGVRVIELVVRADPDPAGAVLATWGDARAD